MTEIDIPSFTDDDDYHDACDSGCREYPDCVTYWTDPALDPTWDDNSPGRECLTCGQYYATQGELTAHFTNRQCDAPHPFMGDHLGRGNNNQNAPEATR